MGQGPEGARRVATMSVILLFQLHAHEGTLPSLSIYDSLGCEPLLIGTKIVVVELVMKIWSFEMNGFVIKSNGLKI